MTMEFKVHLQPSLSYKFHLPVQIFCMILGSFCTISNSISPKICGIKLIITASKLFGHYFSLISLAKHSHNTDICLNVV